MEHQNAGSQYMTGSASRGGEGELDWPGPLELPKSPGSENIFIDWSWYTSRVVQGPSLHT